MELSEEPEPEPEAAPESDPVVVLAVSVLVFPLFDSDPLAELSPP